MLLFNQLSCSHGDVDAPLTRAQADLVLVSQLRMLLPEENILRRFVGLSDILNTVLLNVVCN